MSRAFNGTNQSLQSASALAALAGLSRVTIAAWVKTVYTTDDDLLWETSANSNTTAGAFKIIANDSVVNRLVADHFGNVGKALGGVTSPSNSVWHHIMVNHDMSKTSNEVDTIYLDGSSWPITYDGSLNNNNTGTFTSQILNVMSRNNASLFADGEMAHLCIFGPSAVMTTAAAVHLMNGGDPAALDNCLYYWPLAGTTSPEPATIGTIALTVNGATQGTEPPIGVFPITYKSAGAGFSTETSGVSLVVPFPAVVAAGDIIITHIFWEGTASEPEDYGVGGLTRLSGPHVIESTIARHWIYGKIANGSEGGSSANFNAVDNLSLVTTQRAGRAYSFAGRASGSITNLVNGFAHLSHATDPAMPTVTTTEAGALAVACVAQNDNNALASASGETGGDWVEAVAEYTAALTPGLALGLQTCTPTADPGTVTGGTISTVNDPCGVIGFQIMDSPHPKMPFPPFPFRRVHL